ncbi:glycosyltransferase family 4 protein [Candidatus Microgenomates bacterium]|nr:glycosyltransferase family 4 protein [Candidatus Microgenomates bacterium]
MNVLWLHSHLLYSNGGTRFIFETALRLRKKHKVTVVVEKADEKWIAKFAEIGIKVETLSRYSSNSLIYWLLFPIFLIKEKRQLAKLISNQDVVIASMFPLNYLASMFSKPVIYFCFEPFAFFYDKTLLASLSFFKRTGCLLLSKVYQSFDKKGVAYSSRVMTINQSVADWIKKIYGCKPDKITYLGVDTDFFRRRDIPKPKKWKTNLLLLHCTDYTPLKGTEYLLHALLIIKKKYPQVKLIISETVTDKRVRARYLEQAKNLSIAENVEFLGNLPYQNLPDYYSFSDIVCFAADPETIGTTASLTVLEAMACETPVVRSIGCNEEVIHGKSGFLADPKKPDEYAKMIIRLLENKSRRLQMGREGRNEVLKNYRWDKVADAFLDELDFIDNQMSRKKGK